MWLYDYAVDVSTLEGKTIKTVEGLEKGSDRVKIETECGNVYVFEHEQDCCETVLLDDFDGDGSDLIGGFVLSASEETNSENQPSKYSESWLWTFYKIQTTKGHVWLKWLGESNGYYSESVCFAWINNPNKKEVNYE